MLGCEVSQTDQLLYSLHARGRRLGVFNLTGTAELSYSLSCKVTQEITKAIKSGTDFETDYHLKVAQQVHQEGLKLKEQLQSEILNKVLSQLDQVHMRAVLRASPKKASAWLTVMALGRSQFDMSPREFKDTLAIRYRKPLLNVSELSVLCIVYIE